MNLRTAAAKHSKNMYEHISQTWNSSLTKITKVAVLHIVKLFSSFLLLHGYGQQNMVDLCSFYLHEWGARYQFT